MKTILRLLAILIAASIVAAGFFYAVNNTSLSTGPTADDNQPPAFTSTDGQTTQPMQRPEGRDEGSLSQGISGVFATLAKLSVITVLVLTVEKAFSLIGNRKFKFAQR